ncbi:hypothetical protein LK494_03065 [Anaerovorax odorimutans]|nr:hypothetical protein [Anaerovorax odorimutans]
MKDLTISENIIAVLDDVSKKLGIAVDWTSENIMPYLKDISDRIVKFELTTSIIWMIVAAALMIGMALIGIHIYKVHKTKNAESIFMEKTGYREIIAINFGATITLIAMGIATLICLIVIMMQINDIVKCCVLPERIVVDYISSYL